MSLQPRLGVGLVCPLNWQKMNRLDFQFRCLRFHFECKCEDFVLYSCQTFYTHYTISISLSHRGRAQSSNLWTTRLLTKINQSINPSLFRQSPLTHPNRVHESVLWCSVDDSRALPQSQTWDKCMLTMRFQSPLPFIHWLYDFIHPTC